MPSVELFTLASANKILSVGGGGLLASGFIGLNFLNSKIALGIPQIIPPSLLAQFILIVIIAPFVEEFLFGSIIYKLKEAGRGFLFIQGLTILLFVSLHFFAYGLKLSAYQTYSGLSNSLAASSGLFIGAGIFRGVGNWINEKSSSIISSTIAHICINGFLFFVASGLFFA